MIIYYHKNYSQGQEISKHAPGYGMMFQNPVLRDWRKKD